MVRILLTVVLILGAAHGSAGADVQRAFAGGGAIALGPALAETDDKGAHLIVGAGISVLVTEMTGEPAMGFLAGVAAGALKEAFDSTGVGVVDAGDFAATALGAGMPFMTIRW